jgi:hypothetical protein
MRQVIRNLYFMMNAKVSNDPDVIERYYYSTLACLTFTVSTYIEMLEYRSAASSKTVHHMELS